jgi:hypothetical protein
MSDQKPVEEKAATEPTEEKLELSDEQLLAGPPVETPTLEEVIEAGYKPDVAASIVAKQQAMRARQLELQGDKVGKPIRGVDHVMIYHMKSSRQTRTLRALRKGHRYHDVTMVSGRRIRQRGKRPTEVHHDELVENHQHILELVRVGEIRVHDHTGKELTYEALKGHISNLLDEDQELRVEGDHQDEAKMAALHRQTMEHKDEVEVADKASVELEPHGEPTQENPTLTAELASESKLPDPTPEEVNALPNIEPTPPVDNEHVAEGAEQFSEETIAAAKAAEPAAEADKKSRHGRKGRKE